MAHPRRHSRSLHPENGYMQLQPRRLRSTSSSSPKGAGGLGREGGDGAPTDVNTFSLEMGGVSFRSKFFFAAPVSSHCHLNVQVSNLSIGMNQLAWFPWHGDPRHQRGRERLRHIAQDRHRRVGEGEAQVEGGCVVEGAALGVLDSGHQFKVSVAVGCHSACPWVGLWLF